MGAAGEENCELLNGLSEARERLDYTCLDSFAYGALMRDAYARVA